MRRAISLSLAALVVLAASFSAGAAERPIAPRLLPDRTLVYLRLANAQEFAGQFQDSALGKMLNDEKIKPLIGSLYGSAAEAFSQIQDEVGAPLGELLQLPQGEACFAVVDSGFGPPALVLILDVKDRVVTFRKLIEKGEAFIEREGAGRSTERVGDVEIVTYTGAGQRQREVSWFEQDGTVVIFTDKYVGKTVLARINETDLPQPEGEGELLEEPKTLAENEKFISIMRRCQGAKGERPQFTWFVDPIALAKTSARGNVGAQAGLAFLPVVGLDGLKGVGGSLVTSSEEFDMIMHLHILIDNPRTGIMEMIAFDTGDVTPPAWVPADAASYMTLNWNVEQTYRELAKLYNSFNGEGRLAADVKANLSDEIGVDFEMDILAELTGRVTLVRRVENPDALNGMGNLIAIQVKDGEKFAKTLKTILEKTSAPGEEGSYGGVKIWRFPVPENVEGPLGVEAPKPAFAILGDTLLVSDRASLVEKAIVTKSDASLSLAKELDFKLIASKIGRQVGGDAPAMLSFDRPAESLKFIYNLARSDDAKTLLADGSENNEVVATLNNALKENPLPPFSVLEQYLAPGGGMITNDETGIHYMGFSLRRK